VVARIISGKSIRAPLTYNERKVTQGKARLIMGSRFGGEVDRLSFGQKLRRFEHLTLLNSRVKTNALHITLNFDPSERIGTLKLQAIAAAYMDRIGFGEQPYLVYRHEDAAHPHLHIVTTNIRPDGSRINLHNLGRTLSEAARKSLEKEFSLVQAEGKGQSQEVPLPLEELRSVSYGERPTQQAIHEVVSSVLARYALSSLAELNAVLGVYGVMVERVPRDAKRNRKGGLVYSLCDHRGEQVGVPAKASSLPCRPTLPHLENLFALGKEKRKAFRHSLAVAIDRSLAGGNISREEFIHRLDKQGITAVFHANAQGRTFGITFIDHRQGAVFKGSSLGKGYSAHALSSRLRNNPEIKTHPIENTPGKGRMHPNPIPERGQAAPFHWEGANALKQLITPSPQQEAPIPHTKKGKRKKRRFRL
jgi:hypothetical protein